MRPPAIPYGGLDALGGFFALSRSASTPGWRRGDELIGDLDDALGAYLDRLQTERVDIAGSLLVQGWAARLTAVYVGSIALTGATPDLAADAVDVRLPPDGTVLVHARTTRLLEPATAWRHLADGHLHPLVDAVHGRCRSGRRRLWGNVASVLAGAQILLRHRNIEHVKLEPSELEGLGNWLGPIVYSRRTCCGLVRVPGRAACGDCVLRWRSRSIAAEEVP